MFGIVGCQLLLTAVMAAGEMRGPCVRRFVDIVQVTSTAAPHSLGPLCAVIMFNEPVAHLVLTNLPLQIIFALAPFVCLIPLYIYKVRCMAADPDQLITLMSAPMWGSTLPQPLTSTQIKNIVFPVVQDKYPVNLIILGIFVRPSPSDMLRL